MRKLSLLPVLFLAAWAQETSSIEGRVVNAATGDPLRKVTLTLTRSASGKSEPLTATPDDKGVFAFRGIGPGAYRLTAERTGYQNAAYGAPAPDNPGQVLLVASGNKLDGIVVKMWPDAVISGRLADSNGEPMPNLFVYAYRSIYRSGKRTWTQAGAVQTNDRGEYRIGHLPAGRFRVAALDLNIGISLAGVDSGPLPEQPEAGNIPTWFGNTTDATRAATIELAAGEDRRGTDIRVTRGATVRIRGRVTGAPPDQILVAMLLRKNSGELGSAGGGVAMVQMGEGRFEIKSVQPGPYLIMVRPATDATVASTGVKAVEVGDRHLDNVEIALGGAGEVSGTFNVAGGKIADLPDSMVRLEPVDFDLPDQPSAKPGAEGTFSLKGVFPARYRARVTGLPEDAYLKSVKWNGREVDADGFDAAEPTASMEVVVSRSAGRVTGKVLGAGDQPAAGVVVALVPDSGRESMARTATTDRDGVYQLDRVAPGRYKLFAWESIEPGAYLDGEFMKPFEKRAEALLVEENARPKVNLHLISVRPEGR